MVLKWLVVYGAVQMVLESIAAYGTVERVLKSIAAYGNCTLLGWGQVKVDWLHMFPCSAVLFTLYFNDVAAWCRCLLYEGPRDVLIIC